MSFLERYGFVPTYRNPRPRISPSDLLVHSIPLHRPFPAPEFLPTRSCSSNNQPDEWPYPEES